MQLFMPKPKTPAPLPPLPPPPPKTTTSQLAPEPAAGALPKPASKSPFRIDLGTDGYGSGLNIPT